MKKAIAIIVFGLLWCNVGFAEQYWSNAKNGPTSEEQAKSKFFKDRKLDKLEGIWFFPDSGTVAITKSPTSDNKYLIYLINAPQPKWEKYNGTIEGTIIKTANEKKYPMFLKRWTSTMGEEYTTQSYISVWSNSFKIYKKNEYEYDSKEASRMWPLNYKKYNEQFDVKKEEEEKKKVVKKKEVKITAEEETKIAAEEETKIAAQKITQEEAINNYLSDRELDPIEGIWIVQDNVILSKIEPGIIITIYKSDNNFLCKIIRSKKRTSGSEYCKLIKGSNEVYYSENSDLTFYLDNRAEKIEFNRCIRKSLSPCSAFKKLWPQVASSKTSSNVSASGSAFFVNNKGHIVTNFHVVEECNDQSKIMYKDEEYPAKLIASDKKLDLALLKAELKNTGYLKLSYSPKKMQKIYAAGYPFGKYLSDDLKFTDGIISSLKGFDDNTNQLQISAAINPGNSGGPVINQSGELVGVVVSGLDKEATEGINFAIKSEAVKTFMTANKVKPSSSFYSRELKNDKLLSILEEATVYTFCK